RSRFLRLLKQCLPLLLKFSALLFQFPKTMPHSGLFLGLLSKPGLKFKIDPLEFADPFQQHLPVATKRNDALTDKRNRTVKSLERPDDVFLMPIHIPPRLIYCLTSLPFSQERSSAPNDPARPERISPTCFSTSSSSSVR